MLITHKPITVLYPIILLLSLLLGGCEQSTAPAAETGGIAVRLVWPSPAELQTKSTRGISPRSGMPAEASTVRVRISAPSMSTIQQDFAASAHQGRIENVPAGSSRTLTIQALTSTGSLLADCEKTGLLIEAGKTTQAGDCLFQTVNAKTSTAIEPKMINIAAGCFNMGSPDTEEGRASDESLHNVCVEAFAIGQYEVTFTEYDRYVEAIGADSPDDKGWGRSQRPVVNVSWLDATAYAEWLSNETGKSYRLPTEAEWEYAVRAGTSTPYSFGSDVANLCQYGNGWDKEAQNQAGIAVEAACNDGYYHTAPVGQFTANAWGLQDVHGNVWEWSCSQYVADYDGSEKECLSKNDASTARVRRGGSWFSGPRALRSADRGRDAPGSRGSNNGFRLAQDR